MLYQKNNIPLVIFAGKEYGTGSSRDWAAKGTQLLGVKAVIAESFERIHRSNLLGMGVLPLQFINEYNRNSINLTGEEIIDVIGIDNFSIPNQKLTLIIQYTDKTKLEIPVLCRIDTLNELEYFKNGGILPYVINKLN
jgi:aconitate hydratase